MKITTIYIAFLLFFVSGSAYATINRQDVIRLDGKWKFRVGDRMEWAETIYDDHDWDDIRVPSGWENEGYQGYDGYAWYRIRVYVPENFTKRALELHLGYIDDVDEVYINGEKIGQSGSFPPHFSTAYNAKRVYQLPEHFLQIGEENLIAVRVYDSQLGGGMISGDFKILAKEKIANFDIELSGSWMFNTGRRIDEDRAKPIHVPGLWENQGYYKHDGYAVYFKQVFISDELAEQQLVLMAGRIDDVDQFFINGHFVCGTGEFSSRNGVSMYKEFRNYIIPKDFIIPGQNNLIEIRVYDDRLDGGIVEGPVGIITQNKFRSYWKSKRNK